MVLAQDMAPAVANIQATLQHPLTPEQRQKALFFLGKAHDVEDQPAARDQAWRGLLPPGLGWALPLIREWLRAYP